jgi:hypothetical protein
MLCQKQMGIFQRELVSLFKRLKTASLIADIFLGNFLSFPLLYFMKPLRDRNIPGMTCPKFE